MKSLLITLLVAVCGAYANDVFEGIEPVKTFKDTTHHNPINLIKYTADPGVMVFNDTVYVYGTNDGIIEEMNKDTANNEYSLIHTINVMSSKDLVNWVDHGTIPSAGKDGAAKWAENSWAPTAAHKVIDGKEKFFLYFANSGNGIGVLTSDSPTGPFVDPIGDYLISKQTTNCGDVTWLFDPAVFVDDDGSAYIYFGGGVPGEYDDHPLYKDDPLFEAPRTLRVAKLGDDMISLATDPILLDAPWPYEDSGIHKADGIYYYTYCTNWSAKSPFNKASIGLMKSENPMGPFEFVDTIFNNPGDFFIYYGNNHHTVIPFKGKWYIFYHSEWLNLQNFGEARGYRTTHVDELPYVNGKFLNATGTFEGVPQLGYVSPYEENRAALMAWQAGVHTNGLGATTISYAKGEWTGVSGVNFANGATSVTVKAASANGAVIKVSVDEVDGKVLGYITIPATGDKFETVTAEIAPVYGVKNVFFMASDDVIVDSWSFGNLNDSDSDEEPQEQPGKQQDKVEDSQVEDSQAEDSAN